MRKFGSIALCESVKLGAAASGKGGGMERRAETLLWAAFVLSGAGD